MKPKVEVIEPKLFAGAVADELVACINEAISERGSCSISLAGGSTPGAIYRSLSKPPRVSEVDWGKVDLFLGDERWVPLDDSLSNYRMIQEALLANIQEPKPRLHGVDTSLADPNAGAEAYAKTISKQLNLSGTEMPSIDIVLLGCGEDGHTASVFPGSELSKLSLEQGAKRFGICTAVPHPQSGQRITLTPAALFNGRKIFFIAKGEEKAEIVRRVIEGSEETYVLPSRFFTCSADRVTWLLDSGAAQALSSRN
ncbi:MAG: 6-phosphogluconolactonase [Proteobacteria bacterium]|nr:MAG: 6-phosphogluconolactonase [Pseudomonadota bacterium]